MCKENEHKLVLIDVKKYEEGNNFNSHYVKVYSFFCEKCGEIITKTKEDWCRVEPEWY